MSPILLLCVWGVTVGADPAAAKAVVLPVRVADNAPPQVRDLAAVVERQLVDGLVRHADFRVVSRAELASLVDKTAREQLAGCEAESCLLEIAEALDTKLLVSSQLDLTDSVWTLQASLLDRSSTAARQRFGVRARDAAGVLSSMDTIARQLAGRPAIRVDDPNLTSRLSTDDAGVRSLIKATEAQPGADLSTTWTEVIIQHNRESNALAMVEGGLLLAAGLTAHFVMGPLLGIATMATVYNTTLSGMLDRMDSSTGKYDLSGRFPFPWLFMLLMAALPAPALVLTQTVVGMALAVGLVDALDLGEVSVGKDGCCRDEVRLREAKSPGLGRRMAPFLAALGAALAAGIVVSQYAATYLLGGPLAVASHMVHSVADLPLGPTTMMDSRQFQAANYVFAASGIAFLGGTVLVAAECALGATLLMLSERTPSLVGE
jgi:hypothetical protein